MRSTTSCTPAAVPVSALIKRTDASGVRGCGSWVNLGYPVVMGEMKMRRGRDPGWPCVTCELIAPGLFHRPINNSPDCAPQYAVYAGSAVNQPTRRKLGAIKAGWAAAPPKTRLPHRLCRE